MLEGDRKSRHGGSGIVDDSDTRSQSVGEPVWEKYGVDLDKVTFALLKYCLRAGL